MQRILLLSAFLWTLGIGTVMGQGASQEDVLTPAINATKWRLITEANVMRFGQTSPPALLTPSSGVEIAPTIVMPGATTPRSVNTVITSPIVIGR
jgi:hypothetical protein